MDVRYLPQDADLVALEVVCLLVAFSVFVGRVMYLCQGFIAVRIGVEIGISAVRVNFLQEVAAVLNEVGWGFETV